MENRLVQVIETLLQSVPDASSALAQRLQHIKAMAAAEPDKEGYWRSQLLRVLLSHPELVVQAQTLLGLGKGVEERLQGSPESTSQSAPISQAHTVTRYTDIACPRRIWAQAQRVTVVVRLTVQPSSHSPDLQELDLRTDQPVMVRITAPAFRVLGPAEKPLTVLPDADSELSFDLTPLGMVGYTRISFDFMQGGNPVGAAGVNVEVTAQEVSAAAERTAAQLLAWSPGAPPPPLLLYVAYDRVGGQPQLQFTLYQAGDHIGRAFAPQPLPGDPQGLTKQHYDRLTTLAIEAARGFSKLSSKTMEREIRILGQNLWDEVIPADFKTLYTDMRTQWANQPLMIISDEPYLPWELVWPNESEWEDEAPWAITLRLTRWLRSGADGVMLQGPPVNLICSHLSCIVPTESNLVYIRQEGEFITNLMQQHGVTNTSPPTTDLDSVLAMLEEGAYSWLHISTHGNFQYDNPYQDAVIELNGRQHLTPHHFTGRAIKKHIDDARPAFVFNACHSSRQGWALTNMGGWAQRLLSLGAGLFLAPLWAVSDDMALNFAKAFYSALAAGEPISDALYAGRLAAYRSGDPTWLAYSLYAHPMAEVQMNVPL